MSTRIEFQHCDVDFAAQHITRDGKVIHMENDAMQVLKFFIERPDELHTAEEIMTQALPEHEKSEALLNECIQLLREALGPSGESQDVIKTYPQQGFALIADFEVISTKHDDGNAALAMGQGTASTSSEQTHVASHASKIPQQPRPLTSLGQLVKTPKFLSSNINKALFYIAFIVLIFMLLVLARSAREKPQEQEVSAVAESAMAYPGVIEWRGRPDTKHS